RRGRPPDLTRTGELTVLLGGVEEPLPREALAYAEGRLLAGVGAAR
ncbi:glutamate racemase, partial [Streptomyces sp. SolWspMP-sol7th]